MYGNLKAEMGRNDVTVMSIAKLLGISRDTVSYKLNGCTSFSIEQAFAIKSTFFPTLPIEYLFARDKETA